MWYFEFPELLTKNWEITKVNNYPVPCSIPSYDQDLDQASCHSTVLSSTPAPTLPPLIFPHPPQWGICAKWYTICNVAGQSHIDLPVPKVCFCRRTPGVGDPAVHLICLWTWHKSLEPSAAGAGTSSEKAASARYIWKFQLILVDSLDWAAFGPYVFSR